jgi:hypothetical protein
MASHCPTAGSVRPSTQEIGPGSVLACLLLLQSLLLLLQSLLLLLQSLLLLLQSLLILRALVLLNLLLHLALLLLVLALLLLLLALLFLDLLSICGHESYSFRLSASIRSHRLRRLHSNHRGEGAAIL